MIEDFKDVSGLLEEDRSKIDDKVTIGDKIDIIKPIIPIKPIRAPKFAAMRTLAEYPIPKPVIRREIYQYCIAGGDMTDYTLPYPVTLEEKYLAKICGMDIDVPEPVKKYKTIEQGREVWYTTKLPDYYQYLYALCGFEWDVPYPVIRRDMYLYKNLGYEIETPEPVTREEIYWNGGQATPTTIEGVPPLTFTAKRTGNLEDYTIYGNTSQNGTPTPDSPIEPEFVGDLVSIELDEPLRAVDSENCDTIELTTKTYTKRITDEIILTGDENWKDSGVYSVTRHWDRAPTRKANDTTTYAITNDTIVTVSNNYSFYGSWSVQVKFHNGDPAYSLDDFKAYLRERYQAGNPVKYWYRLSDDKITHQTLDTIPDGMAGVVNGTVTQVQPTEGTVVDTKFNGTLLPNGKYQVYKTYKIPISSAGQTKTIYISEPLRKIGDYADELNYASGTVTRRIKTFIYNGTEGWKNSNWGNGAKYLIPNPYMIGRTQMFCTHFPWVQNATGAQPPCCHSDGTIRLWKEVGISTPDFKAWLAEQYADGNPVKISVILATPIIEQITLPEIPVTAGENTLSVGTTVQPSNMSITYK